MVETKHYCDICGREINTFSDFPYYSIRRLLGWKCTEVDGHVPFTNKFFKTDLLICDDCWKTLKKARKEKKED